MDVGWIAQAWAARGIRAVAVDVTTSEVADSGIRVVRVVAPGLYSNAPAAPHGPWHVCGGRCKDGLYRNRLPALAGHYPTLGHSAVI